MEGVDDWDKSASFLANATSRRSTSSLCFHVSRLLTHEDQRGHEARLRANLAMQFNFVAATNDGAVRLWNSLGFVTVGCLPKAFNHPSKGYVDALVMYKWLET
jgi:ribosomal protein S18 acetylase RimI-like enzyme